MRFDVLTAVNAKVALFLGTKQFRKNLLLSNMKMKAKDSSETLVTFYQTILHYMQEDTNLHFLVGITNIAKTPISFGMSLCLSP
jgi:hypothetical protein